MAKKLYSLEDLASFKFDNLESEPNHCTPKSPRKRNSFWKHTIVEKKERERLLHLLKDFKAVVKS